jgi:flavin-dependent dehydrogenase
MARKSGAEIKERHTVIGIEESKEKTLIKVRCPDGKKEIEAKMVVGCDGPKSRVGRSLGIEDPDEFLHGILGFESTKDFGDFVDVYLNIPGFFSWRIPRGNAGVEYGIAGSMSTDIIGKFEELLENLGVEVENKCSGIIPIGPPKCVSSRRGFLIGDSAGQTKPFTGGGIIYGMTASECAARVVDPNKIETIKRYEIEWRKKIGNEIKVGKLIRKGYSLPQSIQRVGLWFLSGKIGVHMDRPTSLFSMDQFGAMFGGGKKRI